MKYKLLRYYDRRILEFVIYVYSSVLCLLVDVLILRVFGGIFIAVKLRFFKQCCKVLEEFQVDVYKNEFIIFIMGKIYLV